MSTGLAILSALGALLVLIVAAAAWDAWVRARPGRYEAWVSSLGCPGCGTDRCTCTLPDCQDCPKEEWR